MTSFVLATNSVHTSALLCDYLDDRLDGDDVVYAINSLRGGDNTSAEDIRDGEEALNTVVSRLSETVDVEIHQFVREKSPAEDVLNFADEVDADEIVFGVRKRNPTSKVVFGSVAQDILLQGNRPMAVIPREEA